MLFTREFFMFVCYLRVLFVDSPCLHFYSQHSVVVDEQCCTEVLLLDLQGREKQFIANQMCCSNHSI